MREQGLVSGKEESQAADHLCETGLKRATAIDLMHMSGSLCNPGHSDQLAKSVRAATCFDR